MLKEVFRKRDLLGVVLAVLGAAVVVLSSNGEETAVSKAVSFLLFCKSWA